MTVKPTLRTPAEPESEKAFAWLRQRAKARNLKATVHAELAKQEGNFLRVPVYMPLKDAYIKAVKLQELEDAWNNQKPIRHPRLFLVPSGMKPTKQA